MFSFLELVSKSASRSNVVVTFWGTSSPISHRCCISSLDKYFQNFDKYIFLFGELLLQSTHLQISHTITHSVAFLVWKNTFSNLDKYILEFYMSYYHSHYSIFGLDIYILHLYSTRLKNIWYSHPHSCIFGSIFWSGLYRRNLNKHFRTFLSLIWIFDISSWVTVISFSGDKIKKSQSYHNQLRCHNSFSMNGKLGFRAQNQKGLIWL